VDSRERITISKIIQLFEGNFVDLNSPCIQAKQITPTNPSQPAVSSFHSVQPSQQPGSAQPSLGLSGLTRYLKDTSTKVMQTVQQ